MKLPSQVHIQSHPMVALFWSCRSKGYLDDCTKAACMDQMCETEEREKCPWSDAWHFKRERINWQDKFKRFFNFFGQATKLQFHQRSDLTILFLLGMRLSSNKKKKTERETELIFPLETASATLELVLLLDTARIQTFWGACIFCLLQMPQSESTKKKVYIFSRKEQIVIAHHCVHIKMYQIGFEFLSILFILKG